MDGIKLRGLFCGVQNSAMGRVIRQSSQAQILYERALAGRKVKSRGGDFQIDAWMAEVTAQGSVP